MPKVEEEQLREEVKPLKLEDIGYRTVLETTVTNITPAMIGGWNGYLDVYHGRCEPPRPTDVAGKARWWARSLVITAYKKETGKVINYKEAEKLVSLLFGKVGDGSHASAVRVEIEPVCVKPYTIFGGSRKTNQHARLKLRSLGKGKQHHIAYEPKALRFKVRVEIDVLLTHAIVSSLKVSDKEHLNDFITTLITLSFLNAIFLFGIGGAVRKGLGKLAPYSIVLKNADGDILWLHKKYDLLQLIKERFERILSSAKAAKEIIGEVKPQEKEHYCVQYLPPTNEFAWTIVDSVTESELPSIINNLDELYKNVLSNILGVLKGSSHRIGSCNIAALARLIGGLPVTKSKILGKAFSNCTNNILRLRMPSLAFFSILGSSQDALKVLLVAFWPYECLSSVFERCHGGYGGIGTGCVKYVWKYLNGQFGVFPPPITNKGPSPRSYHKRNVQNVQKGRQQYKTPRFRKNKGFGRRGRKRRRGGRDVK